MNIYQLYSRKFNTIHISCKNHRYIILQVICSQKEKKGEKKEKINYK